MDTLTLPTNLNTSQYPKIDEDLLEKYKQNRAVSNTAYYILIIAYTMLMILGSIGNFFVITAIKSNKSKFIPNKKIWKDIICSFLQNNIQMP